MSITTLGVLLATLVSTCQLPLVSGSSAIFQLQNLKHSKCLASTNNDNNGDLTIVDCDADNAGMQVAAWKNYANAPGEIKFANGLCLTVAGTLTTNRDPVNQYACEGAQHQLWKIVGDFNGVFSLQSVKSGKCLTAENADGLLDQYDCYEEQDAPHQFWRIRTPPSALRNVAHSKCLSSENSVNNGALKFASCSGSNIQMNTDPWKVYDTLPSEIRLPNGLCLTVAGTLTSDLDPINQYDCVGADHQKWILAGDYFGEFQIQSVKSKKCLTAENGNGKMDQYTCKERWEAPHQYWTLFQASKNSLQNVAHGKCLVPLNNNNNGPLGYGDCNSPSSLINSNDLKDYAATPGQVTFGNGLCLTVAGTLTSTLDPVNQYACANVPHQTWRLINGAYNGNFQLQNVKSGKCLTAENPNGQIDQYDCTSDANHQYWKIVPNSLTAPEAEVVYVPPPDPCSGKTCDWRKSDLIACCDGAYCKRTSADYGVCIRRCKVEGSECTPGASSDSDQVCCEQMKCENKGDGNKCTRPPPPPTCKLEGEGCGTFKFAKPCCAGSSCKGVDTSGEVPSAICVKGDCHRRGEQCTIGDMNTPCCTSSFCESYKGSLPVCRPARPDCGRRHAKQPGCRLGDASYGFGCCSGRCLFTGYKTSGFLFHQYKDKDYECDCVSINKPCIDDSDCCNSECGPDYRCAT